MRCITTQKIELAKDEVKKEKKKETKKEKNKMKKNDIKLSFDNSCSFNNYVDSCIGTGRMGLALFKEYQDQLRLCQEEIGFKYIILQNSVVK